MACTRLPSPPGTTVIVCTRGRARRGPCVVCGHEGSLLCDGLVPTATGGRRVCSAWLCASHATRLAPDIDWCPACLARPSALVVYTARLGEYRGGDGLDVTAKSGRGDGLAFAPAWSILSPVLAARRRVKALREALDREEGPSAAVTLAGELAAAERAVEACWAPYVEAFTAQMRESHGPSCRQRSLPWRRLLARSSVTLLCYCPDPSRCHRTLLARDLLPRCGATYGGERSRPGAPVTVAEERSLWSGLDPAASEAR